MPDETGMAAVIWVILPFNVNLILPVCPDYLMLCTGFACNATFLQMLATLDINYPGVL